MLSAATSGEGVEKTARLLSDRMRGNRAPAGKQEVLISSVEKKFPHEGGQTLEQGPREAVGHSHLPSQDPECPELTHFL